VVHTLAYQETLRDSGAKNLDLAEIGPVISVLGVEWTSDKECPIYFIISSLLEGLGQCGTFR
jgi:hypothetical protein